MPTNSSIQRLSPRDPLDPFNGLVINDKFEILSRVAVGGMGRIYRARQRPLDRIVAVKVLHSQYTADTPQDTFQRRFFREANILANLQHANIVTVFDYGRIEGSEPEAYFMAMEYLPGQTLLDRLVDRGPLTPPELFGVVRQVARGLREAHKQGLVHRDLKPSNIMLVPEDGGAETVKILDFGLVKVLSDDSEQVTKEGNLLGSPRYMAPEQISHGKVDARTDIYALGVIMYQCLCGAVPFESDQAVQTLMAHLNEPVPPMRERSPTVEVPAPVEELVRRCLSKSPGNRPASVGELLRGIVACEQALGLTPGPLVRGDQESGSVSRPRAMVIPVEDSATMAEGASIRRQAAVASSDGPAPRRWPIFAAIGGVAAVAAVIGAIAIFPWRPGAVSPAPAASASAPLAQRATKFVMWIDSMPTGAAVFDGDEALGTAPMQLSLDSAVLQERPRRLSLRMEGYQPYTIVQGPSDESIRVVATLLPMASDAGRGAAAASSDKTVAPIRTDAGPGQPRPGNTDSDIRLNR